MRKLVRIWVLFAAALAVGSGAAAAPIVDFTGVEVSISANVVADGGQGLFVGVSAPSTAVIGDGSEFSLSIGAATFPSRTLELDFDPAGTVELFALSQFAIGNTSFADFSFELEISLTDAVFTGVTSGGSLVRGSASVSGTDPIVWTFVSEHDNAFGRLMTFGPEAGPVPTLQFTAETPEPSIAVLSIGVVAALWRRRGLGAASRA